MSNLGPYQLFTIAAKEAGGVEKYIKDIERAAVSVAVPGIVMKSVGAGVVLTTGVGVGVLACKKFLEQRKVDREVAEEAKRLLATEIGDKASQLVDPDPAGF